ncbi:hypothetical protein BDQ17DRAFT_1093600 [Cyathus striatus]|nr:hypothetical protein BDQ17DRAFT_1093600 [Cyathus striatus]
MLCVRMRQSNILCAMVFATTSMPYTVVIPSTMVRAITGNSSFFNNLHAISITPHLHFIPSSETHGHRGGLLPRKLHFSTTKLGRMTFHAARRPLSTRHRP